MRVNTDLNMAIVECVSVCVCNCVCVSPYLLLCLCVYTPLAFSQFSRTSLIQQEWKSFLHGVHRRQKEMERKTRGRVEGGGRDRWGGGGEGGGTMNTQNSSFFSTEKSLDF